MHESAGHEANSFVTYTYDDEHLPENGTLVKKDWQDFAKRHRKQRGRFRYFMCGEYGEEGQRPHYHACIFGDDYGADRRLVEEASGSSYYRSESLTRLWGNGNVIVGSLTWDSASYVSDYVLKKQIGEKRVELDRLNMATGEIVSLLPPYASMSRRPGIGKEWIDKWGDDVYPRDLIIVKGKQARPPKYYDSIREKAEPEEMAALKARRRARAEENMEDNTWERLRVKENVVIAKSGLYSRDRIRDEK